MPAVRDVRPGKWSEVIDLFENGHYSAIWGSYDEGDHCFGVRWNKGGEGEQGYPNQDGNPLWYVEPSYLAEPILQVLLTIVQEEGQQNVRNREYLKNIKTAPQGAQRTLGERIRRPGVGRATQRVFPSHFPSCY